MTDTITRTPYPNLPEDFWEVMEDTRTAQGLTQNDVCKALYWGPTAISQYKNGHQNITFERAKQLMDHLGVEDYYLPTPILDIPEEEKEIPTEDALTKDWAKMWDTTPEEALENAIDEFVNELREEFTDLESLEYLKKSIMIGTEQQLKELKQELSADGGVSNTYIFYDRTYDPVELPSEILADRDESALDKFVYKISIVSDKLQQARFAEYSNLRDFIMQDIRMDLIRITNHIEEGWSSIGE